MKHELCGRGEDATAFDRFIQKEGQIGLGKCIYSKFYSFFYFKCTASGCQHDENKTSDIYFNYHIFKW